ncbi:MAG TPA: acyl-CoA thioesterase II, partial [Anaeromyxobacteraceae bacterium]|nr:acyl-CoA thioesterase II [Anaeromyxobacteraceae bacterium]
MIASFQVPDPGLEHAAPMPEAPPPEALVPSSDLRPRRPSPAGPAHPDPGAAASAFGAIEFRPVEPEAARAGREPRQAFWFRAIHRIPDDALLHRCLLAYASDWALSGTALRPHGRTWNDPGMIVASIDHALWFHRPARIDDWLLYSMDSPSAQMARGLARGLIHDRAGRLVASVAQEALMRDVSLSAKAR